MNIEEYAKEHKITVVIIFLAVLIAVYYVFKSYEQSGTVQIDNSVNPALLQAQVAQQSIAAQYASNLLKFNQAQANTQAQLANSELNIEGQLANNALQYKAMTDVANIQAQQNIITNTLQAQTEQQANYLASVNAYNSDTAQILINHQNTQAATNQAAIIAQAGIYNNVIQSQAQMYQTQALAQANIAQSQSDVYIADLNAQAQNYQSYLNAQADIANSQAQIDIANQYAKASVANSQAQVYVANNQAQGAVGTAYNQAEGQIGSSAYAAAAKIGEAAYKYNYFI
jgi:hypothetical protein